MKHTTGEAHNLLSEWRLVRPSAEDHVGWAGRRFPLEVTASRRHDRYRTTGVAGRWTIPDWSLAAAEYDAVHLTVAGYLTTAGRALDVTRDAATVLAGWDPDVTNWLTDVGAAPGPSTTWCRHDPGAAWRPGTP